MEYPDAPLFPNADGSRRSDTGARLVRWTFDLAGDTNRIKREPLDDLAGEFPALRRTARRALLPARLVRGDRRPDDGSAFNAIAHIDHATGKRVDLRIPGRRRPGEPVFVPRSADAAEGDGWLVSRGLSRRPRTAATSWSSTPRTSRAGPIGSAGVPRRVPFGFHGNWRPAR